MRIMRSMMMGVLLATVAAGALAGEKLKDFELRDVSGKQHRLSDYKDSKAIVIMFIATRCPVSNAYNERMVSLYNDYKDKGVTFLAINSNKQESVDEIVEHAKEHGFQFTILKDEGNVVADELDASVTPEIYLMNGSRDLLYHGRIDDSQRETKVTRNDLREALDEVLSGKTVTSSVTKAFGCTIKRVS